MSLTELVAGVFLQGVVGIAWVAIGSATFPSGTTAAYIALSTELGVCAFSSVTRFEPIDGMTAATIGSGSAIDCTPVGITEVVEAGSASRVVESGVTVLERTVRSSFRHVASTDSITGMGVCSEALFAFPSDVSDSTVGVVSETGTVALGTNGVVFSRVGSGAK